nr:tyrosine--tRNA ligase 2, cytoplasmic-like [Aegilops tauschii subsp. strangulata]
MDHDEDLEEVRELTREYCRDMKGENRPIILSHNKLPNLIEDDEFGNIGDPAWAIFMEDREQNLSVKNNGGSRTFHKMEELITDYESGALHSAEVKQALEEALKKIMKTVRAHFAGNSKAKHLAKAMWEYTI